MHFENRIIRDLFFDDADDRFDIIERPSWAQDGKHQFAAIIFKFEGKFYEVSASRSGSYHSDWYYEWEDRKDNELVEVVEVEKCEKIIYEWRAIK